MKLKNHPVKDPELVTIIRNYKQVRARKPDTWIEHARNQKTLRDAITVSALCVNKDNKRHPHQYRIPQGVLEQARDELLDKIRRIRAAKTFDELYSIVSSLDIYGFGKLTAYDVANRIGAFMELFPDRVYLHAGTKAGAKKLLGEVKKEYLFKGDLPKAFRNKSLAYWEIEDILCIYKDRFNRQLDRRGKERFC